MRMYMCGRGGGGDGGRGGVGGGWARGREDGELGVVDCGLDNFWSGNNLVVHSTYS